ncbi:hypothetical protein GCM10011519_03010 [Marmoricola endophyticus]|uniref:PAC2 family protein n=2 Tax=Marmoricola endophyticus TaxID=2040280 RepID=A0A917B9J9_9ACTN|nr:hypothetical protein GCM10011519_03010 [Marmoricola endophyticus]
MSQRIVHIVDDVPELAGEHSRPVLLVALEGFLDAGNASALAVQHLVGDESRVVASFAVDELLDYRARRPPMTFSRYHYTDYEAPRLVVRLLHDGDGTPYLLLSGPEPDVRWEAFCAGVREVVDHFDVPMVGFLAAIPMAVPHTRPVQLTNHATDERLVTQDNMWQAEIRVPSSAQSLLELRLGEWGHDAVGYVAHIPHYVAQLGYPLASAALLDSLGPAVGLTWDSAPLREAAARQAGEIESQIEDSEEVRDVVHGLEQQYDAYQRSQESGSNLLADDEPLPSGDEIGEQFEQFLAGLDRPDEEK